MIRRVVRWSSSATLRSVADARSYVTLAEHPTDMVLLAVSLNQSLHNPFGTQSCTNVVAGLEEL